MVGVRTSAAELEAQASEALRDAFAAVGLHAGAGDDGRCSHRTWSWTDRPDRITVEIKAVNTLDPGRLHAAHLRHSGRPRSPVVVVADRLIGPVPDMLDDLGWGYLDRRGRLRFQAEGIFVNTDVEPHPRHRATPSEPIVGRVAQGAALLMLMTPDHAFGTRELARALPASHSTVHDALARLRACLVGRPLGSAPRPRSLLGPGRRLAGRAHTPVGRLPHGEDDPGSSSGSTPHHSPRAATGPRRTGARPLPSAPSRVPDLYVEPTGAGPRHPGPRSRPNPQRLPAPWRPHRSTPCSARPARIRPATGCSGCIPWWPPSTWRRTAPGARRSWPTGRRLRSSPVSGDTVFLNDGPEGTVAAFVTRRRHRGRPRRRARRPHRRACRDVPDQHRHPGHRATSTWSRTPRPTWWAPRRRRTISSPPNLARRDAGSDTIRLWLGNDQGRDHRDAGRPEDDAVGIEPELSRLFVLAHRWALETAETHDTLSARKRRHRRHPSGHAGRARGHEAALDPLSGRRAQARLGHMGPGPTPRRGTTPTAPSAAPSRVGRRASTELVADAASPGLRRRRHPHPSPSRGLRRPLLVGSPERGPPDRVGRGALATPQITQPTTRPCFGASIKCDTDGNSMGQRAAQRNMVSRWRWRFLLRAPLRPRSTGPSP